MGTTSYTKLALHQVEELKQKGVTFPLSEEQQTGLIQMLQKFDMEQHEDLWANKPIIFWHGERDTVVPYHMSRDYVEQLEKEKSRTYYLFGRTKSRPCRIEKWDFASHAIYGAMFGINHTFCYD